MTKRIKLENQNEIPAKTIRTPWGRLIACLRQLDSVDLIHNAITFGRSNECDILIYRDTFFPNLLGYISKTHFEIREDPEDSHIVFIRDHSKNGTYINGHLIGRGNRVILQNDDKIAVAIRDNLQPVYIFKSMKYVVDDNYLPNSLKGKYVPSKHLGTGACGEVRLLYDKFTYEQFAMKKIHKGRDTLSQLHNINHPYRINTEVEILKSLSHPLIVKMYEIAETDTEVFIVLEFMKGGELNTMLSSSGIRLSENQVKFLFYQIILAVKYLHSQGITHRDLKPNNVLLVDANPYTLLKLTDFGLSKITDRYDNMQTVCGTLHFIAPEILNPRTALYNNQVDVWSLGVILYYMLSKQLPFQSEEKMILMRMILTGTYRMEGPVWDNISRHAKDLVRKMLILDPRKRLNIEEVLNHPWISKDNLMRFMVEKLMASAENGSDPG